MTNTYLRGIDSYSMIQFEDINLDCYSVIKHVKSIDKPYISTHTGKDICLLNDGYYILEYLPKCGEYGVRVFLDENINTLSYYIDIINDIGIETGKGLYYDDLYLDITIDYTDEQKVMVWDEDELQDALDTQDIDKATYDKAYRILKELLNEIANGTNKFVNNDHKKYIEKYFKL